MRRISLCMIMVLIMALGSVSTVFATDTIVVNDNPTPTNESENAPEITPYSVATADVNVKRNSNTAGTVSADAMFRSLAATATCKITLQEKYSGGWRTATNVPTKSAVRTKYNVISIGITYTFKLLKGKVYRAKVVFTDKRGSTTTTSTYYSASF